MTSFASLTYLPFGPATAYTFGDGGVLNKTYDHAYRSTGVTSTPLYLQLMLDAVGNPISVKTSSGQLNPMESYKYDPLYRLQEVDDQTGAAWQSYTYDKTGDRLTKTTAGQVPIQTYAYQAGTHRLVGITGSDASSRSMDANGNTTALQVGSTMYGLGFDDRNRYTLVQKNGTNTVAYHYNGMGERVFKGTGLGNPPTTAFYYDGAGRLLADGSHDYVWADDTLVATWDSGTVNYVYTDGLNTPRAIVGTTTGGPGTYTFGSGTSSVIWTWPYTKNPFGEQIAGNRFGYQFNLRFPGQYFDQESGLIYNLRRDYYPSDGRYIESDPNGLGGGINTYAYVENAPLNNFDPLGLCACPGGTWNEDKFDFGISIAFGGMFAVNKANFRCVSNPNVSVYVRQTSIAGGIMAGVGAGWSLVGEVFDVYDSNDFEGWSTNQCFGSGFIFGGSATCGRPGGGSIGVGPGVGGGLAWGSTYTHILRDTCKKDCGLQ
ncbi:MAG TPA: RHS repeat-associated core domain-containing protein [Rhodanobacteraceae bacterium]|nr:RHS repeat-associated core domain-containing protein [Rhodanobacteraceae bacterium]